MNEFVANRKLFFGENSLDELTNTLDFYKVKRVFFLSYDGKASITEKLKKTMEQSGIAVQVFSGIISEPDTDLVDAAVDKCKNFNADGIVALGGGSVMDTAKAVAMIAKNGGKAVDYQLNGKVATEIALPFFAIPTTAGTGAEATKVSVLYNKEKGFKKSIYHTSMIAEAVFLDPDTIMKLPSSIIASTGVDAITHAIESYTSVFATPITKMYSLKALEILFNNIVKAYENPDDKIAKANMLLGSYLAGCAITAGTCLAHIVGQPVGAIYHIPHGNACSIYLTTSMKLNMEYAESEYCDIAKVIGAKSGGSNREIANEGIRVLEEVISRIGLKTKLTDYVAKEKIDIPYILDNIQTSMGHIKTNPRPVSRELFEQALILSL